MSIISALVAYISMSLLTYFVVSTFFRVKQIKRGYTGVSLNDDQTIVTVLCSIFWPLTVVLGPVVLLFVYSIDFIEDSSISIANFLSGKKND